MRNIKSRWSVESMETEKIVIGFVCLVIPLFLIMVQSPEKYGNKMVLVICILAVIVTGFIFYTNATKKEIKWQEWATEHCKVIEKIDGATSVGVGISTSGQAGAFISPSSNQTGYKCDDGITYWKNH
jgi:thiol:disulfide interchange protein